MTYHVRDYHRVLQTSPLELTERDFDVALSFGGPQEERRLRAAQQRAQLARVPPAPLQTKAAPGLRQSAGNKEVLRAVGEGFDLTVKTLVALRDRVKVLEEQSLALIGRVQELEALTKQQAATLVDLSSENKALGQFLADTQRRPPSREPTPGAIH